MAEDLSAESARVARAPSAPPFEIADLDERIRWMDPISDLGRSASDDRLRPDQFRGAQQRPRDA
jgi:hypothetical protein